MTTLTHAQPPSDWMTRNGVTDFRAKPCHIYDCRMRYTLELNHGRVRIFEYSVPLYDETATTDAILRVFERHINYLREDGFLWQF